MIQSRAVLLRFSSSGPGCTAAGTGKLVARACGRVLPHVTQNSARSKAGLPHFEQNIVNEFFHAHVGEATQGYRCSAPPNSALWSRFMPGKLGHPMVTLRPLGPSPTSGTVWDSSLTIFSIPPLVKISYCAVPPVPAGNSCGRDSPVRSVGLGCPIRSLGAGIRKSGVNMSIIAS